MKARIKVTQQLLQEVRADLERRHPFAFERVGFLTAGASWSSDGGIVLYCRGYHPVDDKDYVSSASVGAMIGSDAMRKAVQAAYRHKSALFHVHSHGGSGRPEFSNVDVRSAHDFVPGFFNALPQMPHGMVVLSNDSACGLWWQGANQRPRYVHEFVQVGARISKFGGRGGTA